MSKMNAKGMRASNARLAASITGVVAKQPDGHALIDRSAAHLRARGGICPLAHCSGRFGGYFHAPAPELLQHNGLKRGKSQGNESHAIHRAIEQATP
jgi:hypothetical protein